MCDRYSFALSKEKIQRRFGITLTYVPEINYNISPGQQIAVVTDASPNQLSLFFWRMYLPKRSHTNDRPQVSCIHHDSILIHPYYKNLVEKKRCLILADGFYCWKKVSKKGVVPYRVVLKWNLPFAMAGIWDTYVDTSTGDAQNVCAVITTSSNPLLNPVGKKMPVILPIEHEKSWLNRNTNFEEVLQLLRPFPAEGMKLFSVSAQINATHINSPDLIQPAAPVDQFGNYVLFSEN